MALPPMSTWLSLLQALCSVLAALCGLQFDSSGEPLPCISFFTLHALKKWKTAYVDFSR